MSIINKNSVSSQTSSLPAPNISGFGQSTSSLVTSSVNTASNWDIVFTGQKANAGDTLTLETYTVIVLYGA
jgi:hypothetical protein